MFLKRKLAASALDTEPKTLDDWVRRAGMTYSRDPRGLDLRVRLLSEEQVLALAEQHGRMYDPGVGAQAVQITALREEVRRLRTELATLRRDKPHEEDVVVPMPVIIPVPVRPVGGVPTVRLRRSVGSDLPDDLVGITVFARLHGGRESQRSTFVKAMHAGRLPVHHGRWKVGRGYVEHALDSAGQRRFWELWHASDWWRACDECLAFQHRPLVVPVRPVPNG